jgi:probable rRNA maturation factor
VRRAELRSFWLELAGTLGRGAEICLVSTDAELRRLNKQFRGKDYATDVLSFPDGDAGEIAISLDGEGTLCG